MKNKKNILIIITIIILFLFVIGLFIMKNLLNKTPLYQQTKTVNGIKFSKANILKKGEEYTFIVTLSNDSDKDLTYESFDVVIKDSNNKKIETLSGYIGGLNQNEIKEVEVSTKTSLKNTYDVEYKVY